VTTIWSDPESINYHLKQWGEIKESTKEFIRFLDDEVLPNGNYLDLGCGAGAATFATSENFKSSTWTGVDLDSKLISIALELSEKSGAKNLNFLEGDLESFAGQSSYDGIISLQTISWLEDFRGAFQNVFLNLNPSWFALSSLFYEGNISAYTQIHEYESNRILSYNTYSITQVEAFADKYGYSLVKCRPFNIAVDLPKPESLDLMGTFTQQVLENNAITRLQISGPLLMNWYMLFFRRT